MTKEELKALGLTDEQVTKIVKDYETYVPKAQHDQQATELQQAKEEQKRISKELDTLKKSNTNNAELAIQIEKMKADAADRQKTYDATIKQMKLDAIVEKTLLTAKAKNPKAVKALLDLADAEAEGDTIKGLDDQLKKLRESDGYLFDAETMTHKIDGIKPGEGVDSADGAEAVTNQQQFEKALGI